MKQLNPASIRDAVLISGSAQLPRNTTDAAVSPSCLAVHMLVDQTTTEVIAASFTAVPDLYIDFLCGQVEGYHFNGGIDALVERVQLQLLSPLQGAVIQALKAAYTRWREARPSAHPRDQARAFRQVAR